MIDYKGKVVLITGGARGFGAEFARGFAGRGATVVIGDINTELGEATVAEISRGGSACHFLSLDVRSDIDWAAAVDYCVSEVGGLDVVINNAGVEISELYIDTTPQACRDLFDINLVGTMLGIKHAFLAMQPGGASGRGGAILNLASVAGLSSTPGLAAYSASKAGVISLTKLAATEAGTFDYGVRANCLCPSLFNTDMGRKLLNDFPGLGLGESVEAVKEGLIARIPVGRFGELSDVVNAALYLCSEEASFINGVALPVDGGMSGAG
ncbi:oxidoreductase [Kineobactrum sediminis]|uniref:Oxidoreductase n=1 Tax=Kineobactrum sediminis TaxID=1905677 RepID=A0A2N5Y087_9GAMM|nr:SDR family oxidoreductase [Kineobactrum sediminis]PLW81796.1 oxidoreductase [Kineobactrum sediminis]